MATDNKWTNEYPTRPGVYWIRNYRISIWGNHVGEAAQTPDVVYVDNDGESFWTGSECGFDKRHVLSAEWYGPILPPDTCPRCGAQAHTGYELICTCMESNMST